MARILLVEGEDTVAEPLAKALARAGHTTTTVHTGAEGLTRAERDRFDLMLVDATLPDADGHEICRVLHLHRRGPVVILSDSREEADRDAWTNGAEDYLVKPVDHRRALSLVQAVLRRWRHGADGHEVLRAGPLELDTRTRRAHVDGHELRLTPKLVALLSRLMRAPGEVVSREELMRDVWGERTPSRTLDVHVGSLRAALHDDPASPRFVHTVRGVGFRLGTEEEMGSA